MKQNKAFKVVIAVLIAVSGVCGIIASVAGNYHRTKPDASESEVPAQSKWDPTGSIKKESDYIPVIVECPDGTPQSTGEKDADIVVDVAEMTRNQEPEVIDGTIAYATKERIGEKR